MTDPASKELSNEQKEIIFLRQQIAQANETIHLLSKALNQKTTTHAAPIEIKRQTLKFYNPEKKEFEPVSQDEVNQLNEDAIELLGFPLMTEPIHA